MKNINLSMESVKKILPFILIAIVFAVGGFFIGKGALSNQGAALYKATPVSSSLKVVSGTPLPPSLVTYTNTKEACNVAGGKSGDSAEKGGLFDGMWKCEFMRANPENNPPTTVVYTFTEDDCTKTLAGKLGGTRQFGGYTMHICNVLKPMAITNSNK